VKDPGIARATNGGRGRVIKGCTDMKQEVLEIRWVRKDEENNIGPKIVMNEAIEGAGRKL